MTCKASGFGLFAAPQSRSNEVPQPPHPLQERSTASAASAAAAHYEHCDFSSRHLGCPYAFSKINARRAGFLSIEGETLQVQCRALSSNAEVYIILLVLYLAHDDRLAALRVIGLCSFSLEIGRERPVSSDFSRQRMDEYPW